MLPPFSQLPAAILLIVGGVVSCFLGQRIFRAVLAIYGFVLGALLASSFMGDSSTAVVVAVAVAGGIGGSLALSLAYFMSVAIVGAALAVAALHVGWMTLGGEPGAWVVVGIAVTGALVALLMQHYVIVTGTAFGGAWILVAGVLVLLDQTSVGAANDQWTTYPLMFGAGRSWAIPAWLALGAIGTFVQLSRLGRSNTRRRKPS
ncbi:MAG: DUF4203 domain-containing protein [Vicinamibacterales bacterium]